MAAPSRGLCELVAPATFKGDELACPWADGGLVEWPSQDRPTKKKKTAPKRSKAMRDDSPFPTDRRVVTPGSSESLGSAWSKNTEPINSHSGVGITRHSSIVITSNAYHRYSEKRMVSMR